MNILQIHNYYRFRGGEEQTVLKEREIMEAQGHHVETVTIDSREIVAKQGFKKIYYILNAFFSLRTVKMMKKSIRSIRPEIIHVHNIFPLLSPSVFYAARKEHIPIVQTIHNYRYLCLNGLFLLNNGAICERCKEGNYLHGIFRRCYQESFLKSGVMGAVLFLHRLLKTFTEKVDLYIPLTNFSKKKLIEAGFPVSKIEIKPHFVSVADFKPIVKYEEYAVCIGRLSREKGLMTLIEAFKKIDKIGLKILGDGPLRRELERSAAGFSQIQFLGFIPGEKRFEILGKAMFLVFPSECYENMPYTILESFACGVPVIASKIGGLKELIREEETGLFFEPGNPIDLQMKIERLSKDTKLLEGMRQKAREEAESRFSEEIGYQNILKIYKKAVS